MHVETIPSLLEELQAVQLVTQLVIPVIALTDNAHHVLKAVDLTTQPKHVQHVTQLLSLIVPFHVLIVTQLVQLVVKPMVLA